MSFSGIFIKFGEALHINQLQERGLIYCNSFHYFKNLQNDAMRADEFETADFIATRDDVILEIWPLDNPEKITKIKTSKLLKQITSPFGNLFCLYSLDMTEMKEGDKIIIDAKLIQNNDTFLIIKDAPQFLTRLKNGLEKRGGYWEHHVVEYIDFSNYYGERSFFQKDKSLNYQQEFRVMLGNSKDEPISFEIGDISDISIKGSTSVLDRAFFVKKGKDLLYVEARE